jgi:hypothetical protein
VLRAKKPDDLNVKVGYAPLKLPFDLYSQLLMERDIKTRLVVDENSNENYGIFNVFVGFRCYQDRENNNIKIRTVTEHLFGEEILWCEVSYDSNSNSLSMNPELAYKAMQAITTGRFRVPYRKMDVKKLPELEKYGEDVLELAERIYREGKKEVEMYNDIIALEKDLLELLER